jgi:hypothetical protein
MDFIETASLKAELQELKPNESPDFTAKYQGKLISIELTALVNPSIRKREQVQKQILKNAELRFKEKYQSELTVNVAFNNQPLLETSIAIKNYGERLFKKIQQAYLKNKETDFHISLRNETTLMDFIDTIYLNNKLSHGFWQRIGAFRVDWISKDYLKSVIAGKEEILSNYRTKYSQNWLILTANHGSKSSAHRFDFMDFSDINSSFEKIFIYKSMENKIVELK